MTAHQGTLLYNLLHGPCTIYNQGRNVRRFTFVGDAVEGLLYAATCSRRLVNVRNPEALTVREFVDTGVFAVTAALVLTKRFSPLWGLLLGALVGIATPLFSLSANGV